MDVDQSALNGSMSWSTCFFRRKTLPRSFRILSLKCLNVVVLLCLLKCLGRRININLWKRLQICGGENKFNYLLFVVFVVNHIRLVITTQKY